MEDSDQSGVVRIAGGGGGSGGGDAYIDFGAEESAVETPSDGERRFTRVRQGVLTVMSSDLVRDLDLTVGIQHESPFTPFLRWFVMLCLFSCFCFDYLCVSDLVRDLSLASV